MKTLTLKDGRQYNLADFDEKLSAELLAWAKKNLPDPLDAISERISKFAPRLQEIMIKDAMAAARLPKSLDHPDVQAMLKTPEGLEQVLMLTFKKHQPELTADQVWAIHRQAVKELGENYIEQPSGE